MFILAETHQRSKQHWLHFYLLLRTIIILFGATFTKLNRNLNQDFNFWLNMSHLSKLWSGISFFTIQSWTTHVHLNNWYTVTDVRSFYKSIMLYANLTAYNFSCLVNVSLQKCKNLGENLTEIYISRAKRTFLLAL